MSLHEPTQRTESSATDPPGAGASHAEQSQPLDRVIFGVAAGLVVAFVVWGIEFIVSVKQHPDKRGR